MQNTYRASLEHRKFCLIGIDRDYIREDINNKPRLAVYTKETLKMFIVAPYSANKIFFFLNESSLEKISLTTSFSLQKYSLF